MAIAVAHNAGSGPSRAGGSALPGDRRGGALRWLAALLGVIVLGALLALVTHAHPAFDATGWMVWGNQTLHWNLDLNAAPSWKPLSFMFTLPYALTGHRVELWLWTITACAGGVAAPLLAGRLAFRLAPREASGPLRWIAPALAALIALVATATMTDGKAFPVSMGYLEQTLIATSDPLDLALWLLAMDRILSRRYGWALAMVWLTALGRPEAWPFLGLYCLWLFIRQPMARARFWAVAALVTVPIAWFLAPAICSNSWFSAGNEDLGKSTAIHGNKLVGVFNRLRWLSAPVFQIEILASIVLVALRRDRRALALVAVGALWGLVEFAFAVKGMSAVERYLIEAFAPLAVVGGIGAAYAITWPAAVFGRASVLLRLAGAAAVVALIVAAVPFIHTSVNSLNGPDGVVTTQKANTAEFNELSSAVSAAGGPKRILSCGPAAVTNGWQSVVAWEMHQNVSSVGDRVTRAIAQKRPVVIFVYYRHVGRWKITALYQPASRAARCGTLAG